MTVMQTCSLIENGPGLRDQTYPKVLNLLVGRRAASPLPKGKHTIWEIRLPKQMEGSKEMYIR
jgi:hypothetical protein